VTAAESLAAGVRRERVDVAIVGGGPAGLAAALELRRLGVAKVVVLEREREAGGVPRHTDHLGFGLRDLHRCVGGPQYAARYRALAAAAGVEVRIETSATAWAGDRTLVLTAPSGLVELAADAIILAAGCRERPRAARLVPGDRPRGILTTGLLQQLVTLQDAPVGRRAVVVGAEHVSFSAILTLAHAGASTVAVVTEEPRHQTYGALAWLTAGRRGVPVLTRQRVSAIRGRGRVESVVLQDVLTETECELACDTVVFTGDWIPDHELARLGGIGIDAGTRGPRVDGALRTSMPGVFAAGNLIHAAETADVAALSGRHAAGAAHAYLHGASPASMWPAVPLPILVAPPLRWIAPNAVAADARRVPHGRFLARVDRFLEKPEIEIRQGERVLGRQRFRSLAPARSVHLDARWLGAVDADGPKVTVRVRSAR
jgi:thioredoxin reductase